MKKRWFVRSGSQASKWTLAAYTVASTTFIAYMAMASVARAVPTTYEFTSNASITFYDGDTDVLAGSFTFDPTTQNLTGAYISITSTPHDYAPENTTYSMPYGAGLNFYGDEIISMTDVAGDVMSLDFTIDGQGNPVELIPDYGAIFTVNLGTIVDETTQGGVEVPEPPALLLLSASVGLLMVVHVVSTCPVGQRSVR
jgi:hypothetical protein